MSPSYDHIADAMPKTSSGGTRIKYIHSVGVVSKCKFTSTGNHPYTGIYQGADFGFCRLACAAHPSATTPMINSLGLKFLINGQSSADVLANTVSPSLTNWNWFQSDLSNHTPFGAKAGVPTKFA